MALAARARSPRGFIIAGLVPAALMLLIGLSGKVTAATLVPGIGPSADWNADWHSVIVRSFWAQADLFSFGMVVAVLHVQARRGRLRLPRNWRTLALAVAVPVGVVAAVRLTPHDAQLSYRPESTVIAAVFAVLLAFVVLPNRDGATARRRGSRRTSRLDQGSPSGWSPTACSFGTSRSSTGFVYMG